MSELSVYHFPGLCYSENGRGILPRQYMSGHRYIILFLAKRVMHITTISDGPSPQIVSTVQREWNWGTLPSVFSSVKTSIGDKHVRILLPDESSYILELTIPSVVQPLQERAYIQQQLSSFIPEVLHANDWDFKEIASSGKEKKVLIFAPLKIAYDAIFKAVQDTGLPIEAVEPVAIAGKRYKNPIIGLAMKKDIEGRDEEVLNIIPQRELSSLSDDFVPEKGHTSPFVWIALLIAFILLGIGGFLWTNQKNSQTSQSTAQPTPTPEIASPTPEPPTPTKEPELNVSSLTVHVLNGTGLPWVSTTIANLLREKGFTEITTGNAETFDYTATVVRKKEGISGKLDTVITDILSEYTVEQSEPLTNDFPYDVLIIVGEKLE